MKDATLKQASKIIDIFCDTPSEQIQNILESGLLADLRDGNIQDIDRNEFRKILGLKSKSELLKFIKLISGDELLEIDAVDGSEIIPGSDDMFKAGIDSDFINWGADEKGSATEKTSVKVFEMIKNATFSQMFGSLNSDVRKLCFTQHQIKKFIRKHRKWLRTDGWGTFFLFESHGELFVAGVRMASDGELDARVGRFGLSGVWGAGGQRRLVVPQLVA